MLANIVQRIVTAYQENFVVIVVRVLLVNVLDLVLENRVKMIRNADLVNIVVIVFKLVLVANVLNLVVLENHVERITIADHVNPVVVLIMTDSVSVLVLEHRVTRMTIVLLGNVVMMITNVKRIAT